MAEFLTNPTFDRVDRVKRAVGDVPLRGDDQLWILGGDLVARISHYVVIIAEAGFVTDGASIPRLAQLVTGWRPWDPPQRRPAIVHDWAYCQKGMRRSLADAAFRQLLEAEGASWFRRWVMWAAVRVGGWPAYRVDQRWGATIKR